MARKARRRAYRAFSSRQSGILAGDGEEAMKNQGYPQAHHGTTGKSVPEALWENQWAEMQWEWERQKWESMRIQTEMARSGTIYGTIND